MGKIMVVATAIVIIIITIIRGGMLEFGVWKFGGRSTQ